MPRLRSAALLLAAAALAGCDAFSPGPDSLTEARALWAETGRADYVVEQRYAFVCHVCDGGGDALDFATVTVRDGKVVEVVDGEGALIFAAEALPQTYEQIALTVEEAFALIEQVERYPEAYPGRFVVAYDPELGYPTRIEIGDDDAEAYSRARLRGLRLL